MSKIINRRTVLAGLAMAAPATAFASSGFQTAPNKRIPRSYTLERFTSLDEDDIYRVNLHVRRGRAVRIQGFTPSQSRKLINNAARDWPGTRQRLLRDAGAFGR